jgi:NAD(P)-dependent dehydrogenase (short-subunit alcohol dehydrogenase family)
MAVGFGSALIVGAGSGLSASVARALKGEGVKLALAARSTADLAGLAQDTGAAVFTCDASRRSDVEKLFADLDASLGAPEIVVFNPSYRTRGPVAELDPAEVEKSLMVSAFGGFLVAQQAVRRMLPKKRGCIVFTGASASVKGYAQSAPFAMGKWRGNCTPRAFTWPMWSSTAASRAIAARIRPARPRACSTPTRSPRPISG